MNRGLEWKDKMGRKRGERANQRGIWRKTAKFKGHLRGNMET